MSGRKEIIIGVIGGGPAGSSFAIKLLRDSRDYGIDSRVILFEPKDFVHDFNSCVGVLSPPVEEVLHTRLGISLPLSMIKRQINCYRLFADSREILLTGNGLEAPTYTVQRAKFDFFLLQRARLYGAEIIPFRVNNLEIIAPGSDGKVRIYAGETSYEVDLAVGAFGLDDTMMSVFERETDYRRPPRVFNAILTKISADPGSIHRKIGCHIYAYLYPSSIPRIEFGAITPKDDHVLVNIAGSSVNHQDLEDFLELPEVVEHLPDFTKSDLEFYKGSFPTAPARGCYGNNYIILGNATGWMRPFKGKGINLAIGTGISAAETVLKFGIRSKDFSLYGEEGLEMVQDYQYGMGLSFFTQIASRMRLLKKIIELGKTDRAINLALYNSVSGHKTFRGIIKEIFQNGVPARWWKVLLNLKESPRKKPRKEDSPMSELIVRKLSAMDAEAVRKIDEKITGKPYEAFWEGKLIARMQSCPETTIGAEIDGNLVGFCLGDIRGWDFNIPKSGWIDIIGVDPEFQNRGIARKMLDTIIEYFRKNDVVNFHVLLDCGDSDLLSYFRSQDFKEGKFVHLQKSV